MKIAVFETEEWERAHFDKVNSGHDFTFTKEPLTSRNVGKYKDAQIVSTFIYSDLKGQVLEAMPRLRLIATRSTGIDHIDAVYCRRKGIRVANVPAYGECTVAEHVFGLILNISHRLHDAIERTRHGDFAQGGLRGFDLKGKTLGVVGTGRIGQCVIAIAKGFGMKVVACDSRVKNELAQNIGFRYVSLDELLRSSDIITLHLPATPSTANFLSVREFDMMKQGIVIINTARGSLIDVQALLGALGTGKVSAVGLDVLPEEPLIREEAELLRHMEQKRPLETLLADQILLRHKNVYITPHTAFNTDEAVMKILDTTVQNISGFVRGEYFNIAVG